MRNKIYSILVLLAALSILVSACATPVAQASSGDPVSNTSAQADDSGDDSDRSISVTGSGVVRVDPDIAYITIGVHTENADAKAAVDANSSQTADVIAVLKEFGIVDDDIQTTNFNIYSYQNYDKPEGPSLIYSVDNSVSVTLRDITKIGDLLSAVVDAGANNIWGIQFDLADKAAAIADARAQAVEAARAQAQALADLAGVELGEVLTISTYGGGYVTPFYGMGGGGGEMAASSVPVTPGQQSITIDVNMVFEIK